MGFDPIAAMAGGAKSAAPVTAAPPSGGGGFDPIAAMSGGGGGATPAAQPGPVASAQAGVNKYLDMIAGSGNQQAMKQAGAIATHNAGGGWFHDVLSALDVPRSVVASATEQAGLGLKSALGNGGPGASLSGFEQGVKDHVTVGHILHTDAGIKNRLVDSIGGIVGDTAIDPLTYLGGVGEVGRGMAVAGHVADAVNAVSKADTAAQSLSKVAQAAKIGKASATDLQAATEAARAASEEAAAKAGLDAAGKPIITGETNARLKTLGMAGLSQPERDFLAQKLGMKMDTGIGLRAPFTAGRKSVTLVPGAVTDPLTGAARMAITRLGDTAFAKKLSESMIPMGALKNASREAALANDGGRAAAIDAITRMAPVAEGTARDFLNTHGPAFAGALKDIPDDAMHLVAPAMEGDTVAAEKMAGMGHDLLPLRKAYDTAADHANQVGVNFGRQENYFPHMLTQQARDALQNGGNLRRAKAAFNGELERTYKPGTEFLGHTLQDGSIDEINQIAHDVYGKDAFDLFSADPREVTANWIRGLSKRVGQQQFANKLDEMGVTHTGDLAMDPEGWKSLGEAGANAGRTAPGYVKDALTKLSESQANPKTPNRALDFYDKALNVWKQYSLAEPSKAFRHTVAGPLWGLFIGNVSLKSIRDGARTWRAYQKGGLEALSPEVRKRVEAGIEHGIFHGHEFHTDEITGPKGALGKVNAKNPLSTKHGYFKKNQEIQRQGQDYWRFAMFNDALNRGLPVAEAARKTRMFLGDPHNITNFERSTARRVVPFYTFLRQNMPTELKALATQPNKFVNGVVSPEQETGQWTPKQSLVPELFKQTGAVGLPLKIGGNEVYVSPDLPFSRFSEMTSGLNQVESQMSPLIQAAIERANNVDTYTNTPFSPYGKRMPGADLPSVLGPILHAIDKNGVYQTKQASTDFGQTTPAGQWQITPRASTILGNFLPMLSQVQGLDTAGSPNKATRQGTSALDALVGGLTFRTNDPSQQTGELLRRQAALKAVIEGLQNKGQLPRYIYGFHA